MLFLFGTRGSQIKSKRAEGDTECPYCRRKNTFVATVFGRFFHLFWIPMFPLSKTTVLECTHCKKSYTASEFPEDIKQVLDKNNELDPPKRPIWHGCGCLIIAAAILLLVLIAIGSAIFQGATNEAVEIEAREQQSGIENASTNPNSTIDSISHQD